MVSWSGSDYSPKIIERTNHKLVLRYHALASQIAGFAVSLLSLVFLVLAVQLDPPKDRADFISLTPFILVPGVLAVGGIAVGITAQTRIYVFDKRTQTIQYEKFNLYQEIANRKQVRKYNISSLRHIQIRDFQALYDFDNSSYSVVLIFESTPNSLVQISLSGEDFDDNLSYKQKLVEELGKFLDLPVHIEPVLARKDTDQLSN